jgi:hypothetical protein
MSQLKRCLTQALVFLAGIGGLADLALGEELKVTSEPNVDARPSKWREFVLVDSTTKGLDGCSRSLR